MKKQFFLFALLSLMLLFITGCEAQTNKTGADYMKNMDINVLIERILSGEMSDDEFMHLNLEVQGNIIDALFPPTQEQRDAWVAEFHERRLTDLNYIIRGDFTPSSNDVDLNLMERFVFAFGGTMGGRGFVLDITHGRVYFNPRAGSFGATVVRLDSNPYHAQFVNSDLERLMQAIDDSGLRDWNETQGHFYDDVEGGGTVWDVGIKFQDGTMLRRRGGGHRDFLPPQEQWEILLNFIDTLGQEIIERHAAESVQVNE